eukprot:1721961-Amphidinium_carterae.1
MKKKSYLVQISAIEAQPLCTFLADLMQIWLQCVLEGVLVDPYDLSATQRVLLQGGQNGGVTGAYAGDFAAAKC